MEIEEKTLFLLISHFIAFLMLIAQWAWMDIGGLFASHIDFSVATFSEYEAMIPDHWLLLIVVLNAIAIALLGLIDFVLLTKKYFINYKVKVEIIETKSDDL